MENQDYDSMDEIILKRLYFGKVMKLHMLNQALDTKTTDIPWSHNNLVDDLKSFDIMLEVYSKKKCHQNI